MSMPCTIDIEQSHDFFHAHVVLDGDVDIRPGDRVLVHGAPVRIAFGQRLVERRLATVERANWMARAWTRFAARFQLGELYEVSFTPGRLT
jgi:hypothetical protein